MKPTQSKTTSTSRQNIDQYRTQKPSSHTHNIKIILQNFRSNSNENTSTSKKHCRKSDSFSSLTKDNEQNESIHSRILAASYSQVQTNPVRHSDKIADRISIFRKLPGKSQRLPIRPCSQPPFSDPNTFFHLICGRQVWCGRSSRNLLWFPSRGKRHDTVVISKTKITFRKVAFEGGRVEEKKGKKKNTPKRRRVRAFADAESHRRVT